MLELGGALAISLCKLEIGQGELPGGPVEATCPWSLRGEMRSRERGLPGAERVIKLTKREMVA